MVGDRHEGENAFEARAATQSAAWLQAVEQVRALGMLRHWVSLFS
jgi:hypothetical protein